MLYTTSIMDKCNIDFYEQHLKRALQIAGPRYVPELNVENETFALVDKILDKKGIEKELFEVERIWREMYEKLSNSIGKARNANQDFLEKNVDSIKKNAEKFKLAGNFYNEQKFYKDVKLFQNQLNVAEKELKNIFEEEKERFEIQNGEGTYKNRSWKGFMASYMCEFPTYRLEELERAVKLCERLHKQIQRMDIEVLPLYEKKAILLIGRGGMGKTHLLCDIVRQQIIRQLPAFLFFGEQFVANNAVEDIILKRLGLEQISFDEFLSWLNEEAEKKQCYIPICIDALNETSQNDYWNSQLLSLVAVVENYENIKLIVSCRSIYLKEVLDEDKISRMAVVEQKGFEHVEIEAMGQFEEYYGIHLNFDYLMHQEYKNPLYVKMLCEVVQEHGNMYAETEDLVKLMDEFFEMKDKKISKEVSISVRECVVRQILDMVAGNMVQKGVDYIQWSKLREYTKKVLMEYDSTQKTQLLLTKLLSENLLKETDSDDEKIVFGYERFYEIIMAQNILAGTAEETIQNIHQAQKLQQISVGTLEMLHILFMRQFQHEILEYFAPKEWSKELVISFGQSLYWRNNKEVTYVTQRLVDILLENKQEEKVRIMLLSVLGVSTKIGFDFNAEYLHIFLRGMQNMYRDYFLSFFLLGSFENEKIIHDICIRSQKLGAHEIPEEGAILWGMTLAWLCSLNDINIRDNASKGLANIFRQNPHIMLKLILKFEQIEEDYIHERLWQSVYSVLLLTEEETILQEIIAYIDKRFVGGQIWPQNVLIRDYIYKTIEYAARRGILSKDELKIYQPPYKSKKLTVVSEKILENWKKEHYKLYFNCMESDFAIYTIPSDVEHYGFSKKKIGGIIMKNILDSGYDENIEKYDQIIDYKYGSLRSRDTSVERIGKKYQKIFLYRCMGMIYDNYKYKPRHLHDEDANRLPGEQGTSFRTIDLTVLPYKVEKNAFRANRIQYPFSRYQEFSDEKWFQKNDVSVYLESLFSKDYDGKEYLILQGYFRDNEKKVPEYREIWVQMRSYFFKREFKRKFLEWLKGKDFEGRWMPEGTNSLYEICIGEYPWSSYMVEYLREMEEEQHFRGHKAAPCYIDPTANDYNNEKDSEFCPSEIAGKFIFPCKKLFEGLGLKWDGKNAFMSKGKPAIYLSEGRDSAIYIDKKILAQYLEQTGQEIVWTVLGEKQKLGDIGFRNFPGRSEFSYSYSLNEGKIVRNHEVFNTLEARDSF